MTEVQNEKTRDWVSTRLQLRAQGTTSSIWARSPSPPQKDKVGKKRKRQHSKEKKKHKKYKEHKKKKRKRESEELAAFKVLKNLWDERQKVADESEQNMFGPTPLKTSGGGKSFSKEYGDALLPGEGEAMAEFVKDNKRIPRRGELISANNIVKFEDLGYVMSGSRNRRMNAVRIRKESQIYSAQEKKDVEPAKSRRSS